MIVVLMMTVLVRVGVAEETYREELTVWPLANDLNLLQFNYEFKISLE